MQTDAAAPPVIWKLPHAMWGLLLASTFCLGFYFQAALARLYSIWMSSDEYSYGIMIPFISAFMLWQRRDRLAQASFEPNWLGVAVLVLGLLLGTLGQLAGSAALSLYAFLVALAGFALAFLGRRGFGVVAAPLAMLILMLPVPDVVFRNLSQVLQLVSSRLGVEILRLLGISVFLEGNVIDLGTMKLQVVEACSGLRYLFSLLTLGIVAAYFFRAPLWQRLLLVASTPFITVLMNSVRIALVGVTVEHFGRGAAEGLLHDFEGLVVFLGCVIILLAEIALLSRLSGRRLQDAFVIALPDLDTKQAQVRTRAVPVTLGVACALLAGAVVAAQVLPKPQQVVPTRKDFSYFPQQVGDWHGRPFPMEKQFLDVLQLDDYMLANYSDSQGRVVNAYVAYYAAQTQRLHDHSPRQCLPGGGWEIRSMAGYTVPGVALDGAPLQVNRVVIEKGQERQLAYYFFRQRNRTLVSESLVKFFMVYDMVMRQRSDGALIRLITPLAAGEPLTGADERLAAFAAELAPRLPDYVPR
jgi:exosortase D (VPLPA-CTERM-specific)